MADICSDITPQEENLLISKLLPTLPGIQRLVGILYAKVEEIKLKYINELNKLIALFAISCPPEPVITQIINKRNNLVEALNRLYVVVDRTANALSGISTFLTAIATVISAAGTIIFAAILTQLVAPIIPNPILLKLNAAVEGGQETLDKIKFTSKGEQRLVPLIEQINSAAIATQLLANTLRNFICKLEGLDKLILGCIPPGSEPQPELKPISEDINKFVTQIEETIDTSDIAADYKGFSFKIEEVPFSPTVNRSRALALNSDNIVLLQSELSFTSTPDILIQELKLVIDRDNLRAD
jgi:hypothetical protein